MPNMLLDDRLFLGVSTRPEYLLLKYGNRHGLVTGATGTGKTVTLQVHGRGLLARRRSGLLRRREGRPVRHRHDGRAQGLGRQARPGDRLRRLGQRQVPGDLLGSVRPPGPPDPHHHLRDGPAAAVAHPRSQRHPGGRAQRRLQVRRRQRPLAARSQGSAGAADRGRIPRLGNLRHLRQCRHRHHRRRTARAARSRAAGRRQFLRRARARRSPI